MRPYGYYSEITNKFQKFDLIFRMYMSEIYRNNNID